MRTFHKRKIRYIRYNVPKILYKYYSIMYFAAMICNFSQQLPVTDDVTVL